MLASYTLEIQNMKHLKYLRYVLRHKWFVFIACYHCDVSLWRALIHDWSKFLPCEWFAYVNTFYGEHPKWGEVSSGQKFAGYPYELTSDYWKPKFDKAWNHHQKFNKHHWQYWLRVDSDIGKMHTAKRCLNKDTGQKTERNTVSRAGSTDLKPISFTVAESDSVAGSTSPSTAVACTKSGSTITGHGIVPTTSKTQRGIARIKKIFSNGLKNRYFVIMEGPRQNVLAAENRQWNFWRWITRAAVAQSTEKNTPAVLADLKHIGGQSKTDSHQFSEYCATTATRQSDSTATVRINKTRILVNDEDGNVCLDCGSNIHSTHLIALQMPEKYANEMVADWWGAGRAITGKWDAISWYEKNAGKIILHEQTEMFVRALLYASKHNFINELEIPTMVGYKKT